MVSVLMTHVVGLSSSAEADLGWENAGLRVGVEDETEKYPKRFLLLGLILFKNILPVLSVEHKEG